MLAVLTNKVPAIMTPVLHFGRVFANMANLRILMQIYQISDISVSRQISARMLSKKLTFQK
jgi:hypothetical protein